jgi:ribosomal protein S2
MVLSQKEADVQMMLAADVHLGTKNCDFQMERYVWKRRSDGMHALPHSLRLSLFFLSLNVRPMLSCDRA